MTSLVGYCQAVRSGGHSFISRRRLLACASRKWQSEAIRSNQKQSEARLSVAQVPAFLRTLVRRLLI